MMWEFGVLEPLGMALGKKEDEGTHTHMMWLGTWTTYELLHASPSGLYDTLMVKVDSSVKENKNKNDLKKKQIQIKYSK